MAVTGDVEIDLDSPVASVLLAYVKEQVLSLKEQELQVRQGTADSVHQMRVAVRRLRSLFATYGALLDIDFVDHIREELKWLGLILGAERDAEVKRQRVSEITSSELNKADFESTTHQLDVQLGEDLRAAHRLVLRTLDDGRYLQLLKDLDALLVEPPFTSLANEPIKKIVPDLVKTDWIRLRRTVSELKEVPADHESALHEVRKSAKRLRYSAETAELVRYKRAHKLVSAAEGVQTILGDYHDGIVTRDLLRSLAEQAKARDASDVEFEHLATLAAGNAKRAEIQFRKAWKRFPSSALH